LDTFTFKGQTKKNVLWDIRLPGGRSTPIVMNNRVYINTGTDHRITVPSELIQLQDRVACYDAQTGKLLWEDRFPIFATDIPNIRIGWASMAGDPKTGRVYCHSCSGLLKCYDANNGKPLWERSLVEEFGEVTGYGGRIHTPIIDEDRVVVSFSGSNWGDFKGPKSGHLFLAFDKMTGDLLWMTNLVDGVKETTYSCPVVAVIDGVRQLITGGADGTVYSINARTGEKLWWFELSKIGLNASVVVDGHYVYATHGQDDVANGGMGRIQCIDARGRGNITSKGGVWKDDLIKAGYASPCIADGILYVIDDGGKLFAYDSKTGKRLWKYNLGRVGKGSPVFVDGKLLLTEVNGNIQMISAGRNRPKVLASARLWGLTSESEDEIYGSPAISNGRVFVATRDRLICFADTSKQAKDGEVPALPAEKPAENKVAHAKLYPFERWLMPGESVTYTVDAFDANGVRLVVDPTAVTDVTLVGLTDCTLDRLTLKVGNNTKHQTGEIHAKIGGVPAKARVMVFPNLPWKFTFDGAKAAPPTWIQGFGRLTPQAFEGDIALLKRGPSPGKPGGTFTFGPPTFKNYTIQADVMAQRTKAANESAAQMADVGVVCQRYSLILRGNTQRVHLESWYAHKERLGNGESFEWEPDTWYTMKLRVDQVGGKAEVKGKVWKRGTAEPPNWTISAVDPVPMTQGAPAIFYYSLANGFYDNVLVTPNP
jgi:outer membrane protein assembly factor BamB